MRKPLVLAGALGIVSLAGACLPPPAPEMVVIGGPVDALPPPGLVQGYPPFPGAMWIEGRRGWNGLRFTWIGGHWSRPLDGTRWVPGRRVLTPDGWRVVPGHWEAEATRRRR